MKISIKQTQIKCTYMGVYIYDSKDAKMKIKEDCSSRCAYCDDYDGHLGVNFYHLEHFAPKKKFPSLEHLYDNFLYSCPFCNWSKSDKWYGSDSSESIVDNKGFVNPKNLEIYEKHLIRNRDGSIGYLTDLGKNIYQDLKLFLPRHQLNFNIDRANDIRNTLKLIPSHIIDQELLKLKYELESVLLDYYEIRLDFNSNNK